MYKWEVHCWEDETGYSPTIGIVETEYPDKGDAMELARYYAETGQFDNRNHQYSASDVSYVTSSRY